MCGIIGSVNYQLNTPTIDKVMGHRGPDEQNTLNLDNVTLHHLRLSILDEEGGKQPMSLENHLHIIYNGEIYNHQEVREKLKLECKSRSDTETILHAYKKVGAKCLEYFDGMFAIAIYDSTKKELFLARDRAGKKPLYFYKKSKSFVFSSELNALNKIIDLEIDEANLAGYFWYGSLLGSQTPYMNVTELKGGHYLTLKLNEGKYETKQWWSILDFYNKPKQNISFSEAKENVRNNLEIAVNRRIETSDLEVGSFLSGGIDSGLVTAIAASKMNSLRTFTVSFPGAYNEAPLAKLVANKYNTNHEEIHINFDSLINDFESIVCRYGEPFSDSSAIPSYYVSKAAKSHLTVILNGDGADELFGGYRRYIPFNKVDFFKNSNLSRIISKTALNILPTTNNKKSLYNYINRLINIGSKSGSDIYFGATLDTFTSYKEKLLKNGESLEVESLISKVYNQKWSGLQKLLCLDFSLLLNGVLLPKMDIATMANSLEGRSPLLSKELLESVPLLQDSYKISGTKTKHILRSIAEDLLPEELVGQPKRGFEIPLKSWIDNELSQVISSYLSSNQAYVRNFIDSSFLNSLLDNRSKVPAEVRAKMLYKMLTFEVWYHKVYKSK